MVEKRVGKLGISLNFYEVWVIFISSYFSANVCGKEFLSSSGQLSRIYFFTTEFFFVLYLDCVISYAFSITRF